MVHMTNVSILDTLNDKDFVSIVFFNDQIHPLVVCNEDSDYDNTNTQSPNDVTRDDVTTTTDGYLPGECGCLKGLNLNSNKHTSVT